MRTINKCRPGCPIWAPNIGMFNPCLEKLIKGVSDDMRLWQAAGGTGSSSADPVAVEWIFLKAYSWAITEAMEAPQPPRSAVNMASSIVIVHNDSIVSTSITYNTYKFVHKST